MLFTKIDNNNHHLIKQSTKSHKYTKSYGSQDSQHVSRCGRCGSPEHTQNEVCPAIGNICRKCNKMDHLRVDPEQIGRDSLEVTDE